MHLVLLCGSRHVFSLCVCVCVCVCVWTLKARKCNRVVTMSCGWHDVSLTTRSCPVPHSSRSNLQRRSLAHNHLLMYCADERGIFAVAHQRGEQEFSELWGRARWRRSRTTTTGKALPSGCDCVMDVDGCVLTM
jgi:hypothetical protein